MNYQVKKISKLRIEVKS